MTDLSPVDDRRRDALKAALALTMAAGAGAARAAVANAAGTTEPVRVGILHSLTGTMQISESVLKDVMLMLIAEQNRKGGLLGRRIEPIVVDPASNWPRFAELAQQLLVKDRVAAVFGCWTSISRKSVRAVFEANDGLLFYPVQFEGEESSRNIFYTGATPNQQAIPAIEFLRQDLGTQRWALIGTDYVYPRTTNKILDAWLRSHGVAAADIMTTYTPFGQTDWRDVVGRVKAFGSTGRRAAVISTINGDANVPFYAELAAQKVSASEIPVMAFSVGEQELSRVDTAPLVGHMAAWNYFMSVKSPLNAEFIPRWRDFTRNPVALTNDPMEAHYIGFNMWVKAVEKARSFDAEKVRQAIVGVKFPNLSGGEAEMLPNHTLRKPVLIGKIERDGQFRIIWRTKDLVAGESWSRQLPENRNVIADWTEPIHCGRFDTAQNNCLDARAETATSEGLGGAPASR